MADSRDFPKDWADEMNDEQVSKSRATVSICNRCHHALSQHEFNACYVKGCLCEGLIAAAPAPQAERIESMVLATEPCPDCGSRHHRSCAAPAETALSISKEVAERLSVKAQFPDGIKVETAGEMTAEQAERFWFDNKLWEKYPSLDLLEIGVFDAMMEFADHFHQTNREACAKQRVEQVERQRDVWKDCAEKTGAKVADLERDRDTLAKACADRATRTEFDVVKTRAEAAESELREMREAAEKLAKRLRTIIGWGHYSTIPADDLFIECGEELEAAEWLLARKAGS